MTSGHTYIRLQGCVSRHSHNPQAATLSPPSVGGAQLVRRPAAWAPQPEGYGWRDHCSTSFRRGRTPATAHRPDRRQSMNASAACYGKMFPPTLVKIDNKEVRG